MCALRERVWVNERKQEERKGQVEASSKGPVKDTLKVKDYISTSRFRETKNLNAFKIVLFLARNIFKFIKWTATKVVFFTTVSYLYRQE